MFTEPINGASSWFKIGDFLAIQPSELGKIVAILFWALILNRLQLKGKREINKIWKLFLFMIAYLIPAFLIVKQPDYGTAAAYTIAFLFMLFVSGLDKKYINNPQAIFTLGETTTPEGFGIGAFHMKEIAERLGGELTAIPLSPIGLTIRMVI